MNTTDRIKVTAQLHTTNVFSEHIPDELTGDELLTNIGKITYQRYWLMRTLVGYFSFDSILLRCVITVLR
jgi:hypothetical protein